MAYSDIQDRLGQQQMANSVLLAEKYSQGNLFPKGSEGNPYSKNPRAQSAKRKRDYKKAQDEKTEAKRVSDEARQREWQRQKDRGERPGERSMPRDFNLMETIGPSLNNLLQIGGAIGGGVVPLLQQLLIRNPNAMAMNFEDAGFGDGGFISPEKPNIYINSGAEAYILEPNGNFKFDGMYDPKRHGKSFPGLGLVQNQRNDGMKIAKLPHTPPIEKIVLPNGKMMDSPLRLKTDQERIKFMEDFSRGYGRYL